MLRLRLNIHAFCLQKLNFVELGNQEHNWVNPVFKNITNFTTQNLKCIIVVEISVGVKANGFGAYFGSDYASRTSF